MISWTSSRLDVLQGREQKVSVRLPQMALTLFSVFPHLPSLLKEEPFEGSKVRADW